MRTQRRNHKVATTTQTQRTVKPGKNGVHGVGTLDSVEVNLNAGFVLCSEFSAPEKQNQTKPNKQYRPVVLGILFFEGSAIFST